jgi:hypothetical protein
MMQDEVFTLRSVSAIDPSLAARRRKIERAAIRKARASKFVRVLNLGAGVQSTALLLMDAMVHRWDRRKEVESFIDQVYIYDPFAFAIFADTQDEPRAVYAHLIKLQAFGTAPILVGSAGRLGDDLINGINSTGQQYVTIPAFTSATEGGESGITRRQCTSEYKISVVERIIRREILGLEPGCPVPDDTKITQSLGLSADEPARIIKTRNRFNASGWAEAEFILSDLELERSDCKAFLTSLGLTVPRSACVFCPFRSNAEWRAIRDHDPEGWARAVEVDEGMRAADLRCDHGLDRRLYLHRSCLPLSKAPIDGPSSESFGFATECQGMCGS